MNKYVVILLFSVCSLTGNAQTQDQSLFLSVGYHWPAFSSSFVPHNQTYEYTSSVYSSLGKGYNFKIGWRKPIHKTASLQVELSYLQGTRHQGTTFIRETFRTLESLAEGYGRMIDISPLAVINLLQRVHLKIGPTLAIAQANYVDYYSSSTKVLEVSRSNWTPSVGWRSGLGVSVIKTSRLTIFTELEITNVRITPHMLSIKSNSSFGDFNVTYSDTLDKVEELKGQRHTTLPSHVLPFGSIGVHIGAHVTLSSEK